MRIEQMNMKDRNYKNLLTLVRVELRTVATPLNPQTIIQNLIARYDGDIYTNQDAYFDLPRFLEILDHEFECKLHKTNVTRAIKKFCTIKELIGFINKSQVGKTAVPNTINTGKPKKKKKIDSIAETTPSASIPSSRPIINTYGVEHEDWLLGYVKADGPKTIASNTDCRSEDGITVGIIDAIITLSHLLTGRDLSNHDAQQAIEDLLALLQPLPLPEIYECEHKELIEKVAAYEANKNKVRSVEPGFELDTLLSKAQENFAYWRERQTHEKCLDDAIDRNGKYTPIGDSAAWNSGYCSGRYSEADWWLKTIQTIIGGARQRKKVDMKRCGPIEPFDLVDDKFANQELAYAAACYAAPIWRDAADKAANAAPIGWPWLSKDWQPSDRLSNLARAKSLLDAEIERVSRSKKNNKEEKSLNNGIYANSRETCKIQVLFHDTHEVYYLLDDLQSFSLINDVKIASTFPYSHVARFIDTYGRILFTEPRNLLHGRILQFIKDLRDDEEPVIKFTITIQRFALVSEHKMEYNREDINKAKYIVDDKKIVEGILGKLSQEQLDYLKHKGINL